RNHWPVGHEKGGAKSNGVGGRDHFSVRFSPRMETLRGRSESILKAADEGQLRSAMQRFLEAQNLLNSFLTLPVNDEATRKFSELQKHKKAKKMRRADMLIACIALAHDELLVTRNVKDYKDVPGL